jgi:hypothetical protein
LKRQIPSAIENEGNKQLVLLDPVDQQHVRLPLEAEKERERERERERENTRLYA